MNGIALLLAAAAMSVDYGWQPTADGQLEYIIQIEPLTLVALRQGEEVASEIDPTVKNVRRFRIRVGSELVPRRTNAGQAKAEPGPYVAVPPPAGISYGWYPMDERGLEFIVQLSPQRLESLKNGDEIAGELPAEAQNVVRMRVRSGSDVLPKQSLPARRNSSPAPSDTMRPEAAVVSPSSPSSPTLNPQPAAPGPQPPAIGPQPPFAASQPVAEPARGGQPALVTPAPVIDMPAPLREPAGGSLRSPAAAADVVAPAAPAAPPAERSIYAPAPDGGRSPYFSPQPPASPSPSSNAWQPAVAPRDASVAAPANGGNGISWSPTPQDAVAGSGGNSTWGSVANTPYGQANTPYGQANTPYGQGGTSYGQGSTTPLAPVVVPQASTSDRYTTQTNPGFNPGFSPFASADTPSGGANASPSFTSTSSPRYTEAQGELDVWPFRKLGFEGTQREKSKPTDFWTSLSETTDESTEPYLRDSTETATEEKPWWGLTVAVFALFASLGGNLYLGWIAVDVYRRYLELASDEFDDGEEDAVDDFDEEEEREVRRHRRERRSVAA
jgi:hypothetical protein